MFGRLNTKFPRSGNPLRPLGNFAFEAQIDSMFFRIAERKRNSFSLPRKATSRSSRGTRRLVLAVKKVPVQIGVT